MYSLSGLSENSNHFWHVCKAQRKSIQQREKKTTFIVRYHLQKIDDCTLHSAHRHTNKHRNLFLLNCGIFHKMNKYMQSCMHVEEARHPSPYPRNALKCQMHVAITFDSQQLEKYYIQLNGDSTQNSTRLMHIRIRILQQKQL